jgi:hypothetical protein
MLHITPADSNLGFIIGRYERFRYKYEPRLARASRTRRVQRIQYTTCLFEDDVEEINSKRVLSTLLTVSYGSGTFPPDPNTCSICLTDFQPEELCTFLPCLHFFHPPCIRPWLANHSTCPYCRGVI